MNNIQKNTGAYYTPEWLSDFIINHLQKNIKFNNKLKLLEPSCGDGVFIKSLNKSLLRKNIGNIVISDINEKALDEAFSHCMNYKTNKVLGDFLKLENIGSFNLIIGNPPYIHKKYLSEEQKQSCYKWYEYAGLKDKRVQNIWTSFIYKSEYLLNDDGILAFVIPEELVRVNYAKDTLNFLKQKFERLELFSLDRVIFGDAGQNTIVIFAYKKHEVKGLFSGQIKVEGLKKDNFKLGGVELNKKDFGIFSQKELGTELKSLDINFINKIEKKLKKINEYTSSQTGIVTGANDFFIISKETMKKHKLDKYCIPVIRKGYYIKDKLDFTNKDFLKIKNEDKPCYLLKIEGTTDDINLIKYLKLGIDEGISKRYKVNTYKPNWYNTPNIWGTKLIFFKRSHIAPKLIYNPEKINVTDSGYRITLNKEGYEKEFQYCFYNSFTLLMMELLGRTYGGGVLEVTPNEFKKLPIPFYTDINENKLAIFYKNIFDDIDDILLENDKYLLGEKLGLTDKEILKISKLRKILLNKRLNKKI